MSNNDDRRSKKSSSSGGGGHGGIRRRLSPALTSLRPLSAAVVNGGSRMFGSSSSSLQPSSTTSSNTALSSTTTSIGEGGEADFLEEEQRHRGEGGEGGGGADSSSTSDSSRSSDSPIAAAPPRTNSSLSSSRFPTLTRKKNHKNTKSQQQQQKRPYLYQENSNRTLVSDTTAASTAPEPSAAAAAASNGRMRKRISMLNRNEKNGDNNITVDSRFRRNGRYWDGRRSSCGTGSNIKINETAGATNNFCLTPDDPSSPRILSWIETGMDYISCQGGDGSGDDTGRHFGSLVEVLQHHHPNDSNNGGGDNDDGPHMAGRNTGDNLISSRDPQDYTRIHEEFFESLLKEQAEIAGLGLPINTDTTNDTNTATTTTNTTNAAGNDLSETIKTGPPPLLQSESRDSQTTISSGVSGTTSTTIESGAASTTTIRKNRPPKLHRITSRIKSSSSSSKKRRSTRDGISHLSSSMPPSDGNSMSHGNTSRRHTFHTSNQPQHFSKVSSIDETMAADHPVHPVNRSVEDPSVISLHMIVAKSNLPKPEKFVHGHCVLQKDKGRGDSPLGCSISATGRSASLAKLRDKMKLVMQVSKGDVRQQSKGNNGGGSGNPSQASKGSSTAATPSRESQNLLSTTGMMMSIPSTGMKRRPAKVSRINRSAGYVETRSMIELQLGFLSMQYGLLLQWDTRHTGKIVFICLRKMCHDSFYTKIPQLLLQNPQPKCASNASALRHGLHPSSKRQHTDARPSSRGGGPSKKDRRRRSRDSTGPPLVVRCRRGNDAVYDRSLEQGATEVVLVDYPYRVPYPPAFDPSVLTIDIHECTGLSKRSDWSLSLTFDGHTEIAHLQYNSDRKLFETARTTPCKWEMAQPHLMTSFDRASLDIRLFERRGGGLKTAHRRLTRRGSSSSINSRSSTTSVNSSGSTNSRSEQTNNRPLHKNSRLASTMPVPLGGLISQPSATDTTLWKLSMPFDHDDSAQLTLTLVHQSQYAQWLYQELKARKKEEQQAAAKEASNTWGSSLLGSYTSFNDDDDDDDDFSYVLDDVDVEDVGPFETVAYCLCGHWWIK